VRAAAEAQVLHGPRTAEAELVRRFEAARVAVHC
jgi:hypothetical protein